MSEPRAKLIEAIRREEARLRVAIGGLSPQRQSELEDGAPPSGLAEMVFSSLHQICSALAALETGGRNERRAVRVGATTLKTESDDD